MGASQEHIESVIEYHPITNCLFTILGGTVTAQDYQEIWAATERLIVAITEDAEAVPDRVLLAAKLLSELILDVTERQERFVA